MNSNSQSAKPPDTYSQRMADILGTAIALATLVLPLFIISYYSPPDVPPNQEFLTYDVAKGSK